jgi:hypothetical protein
MNITVAGSVTYLTVARMLINKTSLSQLTSTYSTDDERLKIAETICGLTFDDTYQTISSARTKGTGDWLFKHPRFENWAKSNSLLWLVGERKFYDTLSCLLYVLTGVQRALEKLISGL